MSPELEHVWSAVLDRLTDPALASDDNPVLSRQQQAWLRLVQPIAVVNGFAMLAAPSAFARDNIESVLRGPITRALSTQLGEPVRSRRPTGTPRRRSTSTRSTDPSPTATTPPRPGVPPG